MKNMEFNPIKENYAIKQDRVYRAELFEDSLESVKSEFRDLVFICEDERVSYHSDLVSSISPVIRDFVQKSKSCECSTFVMRQVELFVTLDGVQSDVLELVMSSVYRARPLTFPKSDLGDISKLFIMLGIQEKMFKIENASNLGVPRNVDNKPVRNNFKRKVHAGEENFVQKRMKSQVQENHEDYGREIMNSVHGKRAEKMFVDHKSITMTKVGANPESNQSPNINNQLHLEQQPLMDRQPTIIRQSPINLPSSISILPSSISILPSSASSYQSENKIQNYLPHLSVTSVNPQDNLETMNEESNNIDTDSVFEDQEPEFQENNVSDEFGQNPPLVAQVYSEEFGPNQSTTGSAEFGQNESHLGSGIMDQSDSQGLKCPIAFCQNSKYFRTRSEIVMHIAHEHYKDQLLDMHPWSKGGSCQLCVAQQKPKIYQITNNKKSFIMHVGVTHEVVMDLLPQELRDALNAMGTRKKGRKSKKSIALDGEGSRNFLESEDVSFQNNSFEDNEPDQVYDDYNYEEGSANYDQYQEAPKPYDDQYPKDGSFKDPYQEVPNMYNNPFQESSVAFENPNNESYEDTKPYDGYEDTKPVSELYEGSIVLAPNSNEVVKEETNPQQSNVSEPYDQVPQDGQEGSFLTSSRFNEISHGLPRKPKKAGHLTCHLCTMRSFPKRDDLLFHLTFSHFSKDLLQKYPFIENKDCDLCSEDPVAATTMSSHLRHTGVGHGEVLQFLTQDVADQISQEESNPKILTQPDNSREKTEPEEMRSEVGNSYEIKQEVANSEKVNAEEIENVLDKPNERPSEPVAIKCSLCPNKVRMYSKRSDFLKHLSLGHYGKNILQVNPYQEGHICSMCQENNSKVFVPTKKEIHVCHVGVLHGKVFDYLSEDLLELVKTLPTLKKAAVVKTDPSEAAAPTEATLQEEVAS